MAETLGSLCDKLTVVILKQWHTEEADKLRSLAEQEKQLQEEIGEYLNAAVRGDIPLKRLTFDANKIYKSEGNIVDEIFGNIGEVFSLLVNINCALWHEQEKVYDFEKVPSEEKNNVVKKLAKLNLERNKCIDQINSQLRIIVENKKKQ